MHKKIQLGKEINDLFCFIFWRKNKCFRQILNQTSSRNQLIGRWVFLGTDGWGKKWYPVENFGRAAINAITIAPKLYPISG